MPNYNTTLQINNSSLEANLDNVQIASEKGYFIYKYYSIV